MTLFALFATGELAYSQVAARQRNRQARPGRPTVLIEPTAPVANLLDRAEDGIRRNDWKFALDCLQRVIDDPDGSLVARENPTSQWTHFETARRYATQRLSSLPPEGLSAYRLLFDGKAKRLYERGQTSEDSSDLRAVATRYLLTSYGDDAADLLASRALDAGRASEAISILNDVVDLVPDRDIPETMIAAKMAAAYAMQGRMDQASLILERFKTDLGTRTSSSLAQLIPSMDALEALTPESLKTIHEPRSWPYTGGFLDRRAQMPLVEPGIVHDVPWRFELEEPGGDSWRRVFSDDPAGALWLPPVQPVAADGVLFVRTATGCVAVNMDDLSPFWESREPGASMSVEPSTPSRQMIRALPQSHVPIQNESVDYLSAGIALGPDVVLTVSRKGSATYLHSTSDVVATDAAPVVLPQADQRTIGTRLIAYDQHTGNLRWQRGRTANPVDPLGAVKFQSLPLTIDDQLWVPFFRRNDLSVAVLNAGDGSLIEEILLCSIRGATTDGSADLSPAFSDGMVYVPSGHGVLFALNARERSLKWATQLVSANELRQPSAQITDPSWLPSPPIVAGGRIIVAPVEASQLVVLSAETGSPQWSMDYGKSRYLIAADSDSIWIGGRTIERVSLDHGEVHWNATIPASPTGRAVLSGDLVHVPVLDGLISLDAQSGEARSYTDSTVSDEPLGNLLCLDAALYSVSSSGIRRFPDIKKSYLQTLESFRNEPGEPVTAIRLAWLELLQGRIQEAHEVVLSMPPEWLEDPSRVGAQASRVKVEVLLKLAEQQSDGKKQNRASIALLEEARLAARRRDDVLRCELAISDALVQAQRHDEAYRRLWKLGTSDPASASFRIGSQVAGSVRFDISRRLDRISQDLTSTQREALQEALEKRSEIAIENLLNDSRSRDSARYLEATAELASSTLHGQEAMLALANDNFERGRHEIAEFFFRQAIAASTEQKIAMRGLIALSQLYLRESYAGADATGLLVQTLERLESRFGTDILPGDADKLSSTQARQSVLIRDWVQRQRKKIGADRLASYSANDSATLYALEGEPVWSLNWQAASAAPASIVRFDKGLPSVLSERVVIHDNRDLVSCYNAFDGTLVWEADLRRPETFASLDETTKRMNFRVRRQAVADGQIGVFQSRDGLFGVGLVTGRRLWFKPFALAGEMDTPTDRDRTMAAGDGLIAATPKAGRLTLMRMHDGSTVWERDLRAEPVDRLWMYGNRIVTADEKMERVNIINRDDGSLVKMVQFSQPDEEGGFLSVTGTNGVLCGPDSNLVGDSIIGIRLEDGQPAWNLSLDKPPIEIFSPQDGYVAVSLFRGDIRMIEVKSGDVMPTRNLSGTIKIFDGRLVDGTLLLQHVAIRKKSQTAKLAAIDIATGDELWQRDDIVSLALARDPLQTVGGTVPAVMAPRDARKQQRQSLAMIDMRTGQNIGDPVSPTLIRGNNRLNGDFVMLPVSKVMVLGTRNGVIALPMKEPTTTSDEGL